MAEGRGSTVPDGARFVLVVILAAYPPTHAQSADTYFEPSVGITAEYDDNVRLDPVDDDSQSILELIGEAEIGAKTRTREAVLNAATHITRYSDSELDSTDWFLDLDLLRRWRRDQLSLLASYSRASTITTELEDTGRLQADRFREDWTISPAWTRQWSRRTETSLQYEYADTAFDDSDSGDGNGFTDYRQHSIEAAVTRAVNRTTDLFGRADYARFDADDGTESDTVSLLAGAERDFSRRLRGGVGVGLQHTDTEFPATDGAAESESDTGAIYEAYATWQLDRGAVSVEGSRSVQPSGFGVRSETDRVTAAWDRPLTRDWSLNVNAAAAWQNFAQTVSRDVNDRVYYNAEAKVTWQGRPRLQVDLAYRYRRQEFDEPPDPDSNADSAESNSVWVTMRYTWAQMDPFQ